MNKTICYVEKFGSYQQMTKIGKWKNVYKTPEYKAYEWELKPGVMKLKKITNPKTPIMLKLTFNVKGGIEPPTWRLIIKKTGNTAKICYSKEEALKHKKKCHNISYKGVKLLYGTTGDIDNLTKPVQDFIEEMKIVPNDRQIRKADTSFTYNNRRNSIEIELIELETIIDSNGKITFKEKEDL